MIKNRIASLLTACCVASLASVSAQAQTQPNAWPTQPIRWVVGFAAGGTADTLTRLAAEKLSNDIGQSVVVENRPGASGAIALQYVAKTSPEETVLITVPGPIIYPAIQPAIGKELAPVILMAQGPMVIVGPAKNQANTLKEVIADARTHPDAWSYATSGTGTSQHLAGELLNYSAKTQITAIPYKGGGQAVADVVGGHVPLAILGPTPVMPHIESKTLKAYAVTTSYRLDSLPDVPTVQESGFPGYDASQWFAVATVQGVADARAAKLNTLLSAAIATPQFQAALKSAGMIASPGSPADLQSFVDKDTQKWDELIQKAGLSVTN